jgi:methylmalonyl-CoA mutase cobalamin-binding domain/chain
VPICDGHDSPIITVNIELVRHGVEVIYLGYHRSVQDIVRAAIQEDVQAIGLSSYNGGHVEFFSEVVSALRRSRAGNIGVFGGGGGTITPADATLMKRRGVDEIFFAGTPLIEIVEFVKERYRGQGRAKPSVGKTGQACSDLVLARALTDAEKGDDRRVARPMRNRNSQVSHTVGFTGPGGAGKTTLIDELVLRFLRDNPDGRIAILSHDPSLVGAGALLGDRATMIYSQDNRVFMRSLATRSQAGGLSPATARCLQILKRAGFDLVIVETVGIGQEAMPFGQSLVDRSVLVMSPDYGSRLQLQKIAMLDLADLVVVNKFDLPGAKTAAAEIEQRLARNHRGQLLLSTVAKRHGDPGVDELFRKVMS